MARTRTGSFPIGFRRLGSSWQAGLDDVIAFARTEDFDVIDLGDDGADGVAQVRSAGLTVGAVDLPDWGGLMSVDDEVRHAAVARDAEHIRDCAASGPTDHFIVMLPEDPSRRRADNFASLVTSLTELAPVLESSSARVVIEAYPGAGAICCTPESCRELFRLVPSPAIGLNFDPSHFVRMGIDVLRFLDEFVDRVHHVHAKDTEIDDRLLYELGHELPGTFESEGLFRGRPWRYALPGHGSVPWRQLFDHLDRAGYTGSVSVEHEDDAFTGTPEIEAAALCAARDFLATC